MTYTRTDPGRLFAALVCPVCGGDLALSGRSFLCPDRHTFDLARHGYLSLLSGRSAASADTAAMVQARTAFLDAGHYDHLARALATAATSLCPTDGTVLDAGVGTGSYLAAVLDALPNAVGVGLDASKYAARRAARAHPRGGAATWDLWRPLPVRTAAVDLVLNVFAPRNGAEFRRVLRAGGALLVVTPGPEHLAELRDRMGLLSVDAAKEERLHRSLAEWFAAERSDSLDAALTLGADDVEHLVSMGPSAWHVGSEEIRRRTAELEVPVRVTASFQLSVYRPR